MRKNADKITAVKIVIGLAILFVLCWMWDNYVYDKDMSAEKQRERLYNENMLD